MLLIAIGILLIANLGLYFGERGSTGLEYDESMFAIQDTVGLTTIRIGEISLKKSDIWMVGESPADPAFMDHLLNILMRVSVKKPIGETDEEGILIDIEGQDSFYFGSNETKTKSYFFKDGEGYEMEIPGFSDYLGDIFELEEDQWRDRLVYDGNWRTIQKLRMDYTANDQNDFEIAFETEFFKVSGVNVIDTVNLMNYLNQFEYFQANERISRGRIPELDSISASDPVAILTIDDINFPTPFSIQIFERRLEDPFHLMLDGEGEMIVVVPLG